MADSVLKTTRVMKENKQGLKPLDYQGGKSTLCAGCGHDAISNQIVRAFYEMSVEPEASRSSPASAARRRPPPTSSGARPRVQRRPRQDARGGHGRAAGEPHLVGIGVSGDGDTASIGLGQFMHMVRRNIPMIYVIENNGVYGLTKGQFSATADEGSKLKTGVINDLPPMDMCALAVELGCGFVARGFAGDPKQMVAILKAAIAHDGMSVIDVISPCVTFNNHEGSTKSYQYSKEHQELLHQIGFVPHHRGDPPRRGAGRLLPGRQPRPLPLRWARLRPDRQGRGPRDAPPEPPREGVPDRHPLPRAREAELREAPQHGRRTPHDARR
jgi:2-oxoglutarate/2-oxoacid ferredoxin oxidoreductase subunit beta